MAAKARRIIYTGAFAGITATGAIYGAQLKMGKEQETAARKLLQEDITNTKEASAEEKLKARQNEAQAMATFNAQQIVAMEARRSELLRQRFALQKKLDAHQEKVMQAKATKTANATPTAEPKTASQPR